VYLSWSCLLALLLRNGCPGTYLQGLSGLQVAQLWHCIRTWYNNNCEALHVASTQQMLIPSYDSYYKKERSTYDVITKALLRSEISKIQTQNFWKQNFSSPQTTGKLKMTYKNNSFISHGIIISLISKMCSPPLQPHF
jgi:hypothetical protein